MPLIPKQEPPYYEPGAATEGTKYYTALISQTSTTNPTVVELQDTIENIVWTRSAAGDYRGTKPGAFLANKVWANISNNTSDELVAMSLQRYDDDQVRLVTNVNGTPQDDNLVNTSIQIIVYP